MKKKLLKSTLVGTIMMCQMFATTSVASAEEELSLVEVENEKEVVTVSENDMELVSEFVESNYGATFLQGDEFCVLSEDSVLNPTFSEDTISKERIYDFQISAIGLRWTGPWGREILEDNLGDFGFEWDGKSSIEFKELLEFSNDDNMEVGNRAEMYILYYTLLDEGDSIENYKDGSYPEYDMSTVCCGFITGIEKGSTFTFVSGDFCYVIGDGDIAVSKYNGDSEKIVVPDEIEGRKVTSIEAFFCTSNSTVKEIELPEGITGIDMAAFASCKNLEKISLPEGLNYISYQTFWMCEKLSEIELPDSLQIISEDAFSDCTSLSKVVLPDKLTKIESSAFHGCKNLKEITVPKSVVEIENKAFGYFTGDDWETEKMEDFKIYGYKDTAAETYADENGFEFIALDEDETKETTTKPEETTTVKTDETEENTTTKQEETTTVKTDETEENTTTKQEETTTVKTDETEENTTTKQEETTTVNETQSSDSKNADNGKDLPDTGDNSHAVVYFMMGAAAIGSVIIARKAKYVK